MSPVPDAQRWRLDVAYDGGAFCGWQIQPNGRTVQGDLERAVERLMGHPVRVAGAGRTDSGVHARQQVASFVSATQRAEDALCKGLNGLLGEDLCCLSAQWVPASFDPRHNPHVKRYEYTWYDRPMRNPLVRRHTVYSRGRLDAEAMNQAVQAMIGTHNFASFRAAGCSSTHPVRTLVNASVLRDGDQVQLQVQGTGFLRHMIRIVAGSLLEVGKGRRSVGWFVDVIAQQDREAAGPTAPAHGLTLAWITY
ncbi:MAG: tRNA pseudouridine(38-40) synthase TruA, partial [Rhodobacterales bacterium]|nr:tRNA pseudouridine(38-40) synthase TruA [Rhodobacterales bacterium]